MSDLIHSIRLLGVTLLITLALLVAPKRCMVRKALFDALEPFLEGQLDFVKRKTE